MSTRYLLKRLAQALPAVAAILVLTFFLIHLAPGDPSVALGGEHGDPGYYALIRAKFGLDRPLSVQFLVYAGNVIGGDLGTSFVHGRPVIHVIAERLPATLLLMSTALVLSTIAGVALGTIAARHVRRPTDLLLRSFALAGQAAPSFWLAQAAILTLAIGTGLFPVQGMTDARRVSTGFAHVADVARHLVLPALVLAAGELALTTRLVRVALIEAFGTDYVRTARAKGLPERTVTRHALRNTLLPIITLIGSRVGMLCAGAVLVESVFAWPGVGHLLLASLLARDYPMLLGVFLLVSVSVVLANLLTDLACGWLDPRIRYE